ncbi:hypothetical protein GF362_02490 [Candidatus Dojkabacteria bacterium]|nr:hypothetical protein [Candidatus Dojkabacteria bacterium]
MRKKLPSIIIIFLVIINLYSVFIIFSKSVLSNTSQMNLNSVHDVLGLSSSQDEIHLKQIPEEIQIPVDNVTISINTQDIFFENGLLKEEYIYKTIKDKLEKEILSNETISYIDYDASTKEIFICKIGISEVEFPIEPIIRFLRNYESGDSIPDFSIQYKSLSKKGQFNNHICSSINKFEAQFKHLEGNDFLSEEDIDQTFNYYLEKNNDVKVVLNNENVIQYRLEQMKKDLDQEEQIPEYKAYGQYLYFLNEYIPQSRINVGETLAAFRIALDLGGTSAKFTISKDQSEIPLHYRGYAVKYFPVEVGSGIARFPINENRGWISRRVVRESIVKGLDQLNGYIIQPHSQFSLIQALNAQVYHWDRDANVLLGTKRGASDYSIGICGVSTITFRAALTSGFPIVERHGHQQALENYQYPYGGLVDAALFFWDEKKEDLQFVNNSNYPVLIVTNHYVDEDEIFYYEINFYSTEKFKKKQVLLADFKREEHEKGKGFVEEFTRYIDGQPEMFRTQYYSSDF